MDNGWRLLRVVMTGATGSARLNTDGGLLTGIHITGSVPGTADITIKEVLPSGGATRTIITLTNVTLPYDCVPQVQTVTETGANSGNYAYRDTGGSFIADVAQGAAGNTDIWLLIK